MQMQCTKQITLLRLKSKKNRTLKKNTMKFNLEKLGTIGLFITAIFSPCCFPIFAFISTATGLGSFELFGGYTMYIFQLMVLISLLGLFISYRKHQCTYPLILASLSSLFIFYAYYFCAPIYCDYLIYAGMAGMLMATIWNFRRNRLHNSFKNGIFQSTSKVILNSTISCPNCQHKKTEVMPTNSCMFFYECENCNIRLKPLQGDCCVFCSYGTVICPPKQKGNNCC